MTLPGRLAAEAERFDEITYAIGYFHPDADNVEPELTAAEAEARGCYVGEEGELKSFDLGAARPAMALASVGTDSAASCRGQLSFSAWSPYTIFMTVIGRSKTDWLHPLVQAAACGCGWANERPDLFCVVAPSITGKMRPSDSILTEVASNWPTRLSRSVEFELSRKEPVRC